jgi:hypothetical protein
VLTRDTVFAPRALRPAGQRAGRGGPGSYLATELHEVASKQVRGRCRFTVDAVYTSGYFDGSGTGRASLDLATAAMTDAAQRHVDERGVDQLEGVRLVSVEALDVSTARITIEVTVYPLFGVEALLPFADGITLQATGQSRSF